MERESCLLPRERHVLVFFSPTSFECSKEGSKGSGKLAFGGKGNKMGLGLTLPLVCWMAVTHVPGSQLPVTEEGEAACSLSTLLPCAMLVETEAPKQPKEW